MNEIQPNELPTDEKRKGQKKIRKWYIIPSKFNSRPGTVLVSLNVKEDSKKYGCTVVSVDKKSKSIRFKFTKHAVKYSVIKKAFKAGGFSETKTSNWNVMWGKRLKESEFAYILPNQKVNHFPGTWELGRKDTLYRHLSKMRRIHGPQDFDFFPQTYLLPVDKSLLTLEMETQKKKKNIYIVKPKASACGRGIKIINSMDQIPNNECLVQRYITNPLLIGGKKFDLRLYVAITSFDPLKIFLHKEGLVRFATEKYSLKNLSNRFIHLTNWSVNKKAKNFVKNVDASKDDVGSKWSISALRRYFLQNNIDDTQIWIKIKDIIIKTVISVESSINGIAKRVLTKNPDACFEIFGFDILIDDKLKPWLLEVNSAPSLNSSTPLDKKIKSELLVDLFNLVGFYPFVIMNKTEKFNGIDPPIRRSVFDLKKRGIVYPLSKLDLKIINDFEDESMRLGNFERIFPTKETGYKYGKYFEVERYNNLLLAIYLNSNNGRKTFTMDTQIEKFWSVRSPRSRSVASNYPKMEKPKILFPNRVQYMRRSISSAPTMYKVNKVQL